MAERLTIERKILSAESEPLGRDRESSENGL
jgi:hypothetical protein